MADVRLNSLTFPDLPDRYVIKDYDAIVAQMQEDIYNVYPRKSLPSAPIHVISDGADNVPIKAMSVAVRAVQDLHGQTSPYPAGASKNILPLSLSHMKSINTAGTWSGNAYTYLGVTYTVKTDDGGNVLEITSSGTSSGAANFVICNPVPCVANTEYKVNGITGGSSSTYNFRLGKANNDYWMSVSDGDMSATPTESSFTIRLNVASGLNMSGKTFKPMIRLASVADATFAPYSNICPISGWDEASVVGSGKNILPLTADTINNSVATGGMTIALNADGSFTMSGTATQNYRYVMLSGVSGALRAGNYTFSIGSALTIRTYIEVKYADGTTENFGFINAGSTSATFTLSKDAVSYRMVFSQITENTAYNITVYAMLRLSSFADATYAPYNGHLVTIDFGGTVYGGTLRYVGGKEWEFTPTHAVVDMGSETLTWGYDNTLNRFYTTDLANILVIPAYQSTVPDIMCSAYAPVAYNSFTDYTSAITPSGNICIRDAAYGGDAAAFKAGVSGQKICYKLKTPLAPITLTASADTVTEYGDNVMFADCGDSTLTYRQDIGLVIGE